MRSSSCSNRSPFMAGALRRAPHAGLRTRAACTQTANALRREALRAAPSHAGALHLCPVTAKWWARQASTWQGRRAALSLRSLECEASRRPSSLDGLPRRASYGVERLDGVMERSGDGGDGGLRRPRAPASARSSLAGAHDVSAHRSPGANHPDRDVLVDERVVDDGRPALATHRAIRSAQGM